MSSSGSWSPRKGLGASPKTTKNNRKGERKRRGNDALPDLKARNSEFQFRWPEHELVHQSETFQLRFIKGNQSCDCSNRPGPGIGNDLVRPKLMELVLDSHG